MRKITNHFLVRTEWHFAQRRGRGRRLVPMPLDKVVLPGASSVVVVVPTWEKPTKGTKVKIEIEQWRAGPLV